MDGGMHMVECLCFHCDRCLQYLCIRVLSSQGEILPSLHLRPIEINYLRRNEMIVIIVG